MGELGLHTPGAALISITCFSFPLAQLFVQYAWSLGAVFTDLLADDARPLRASALKASFPRR